MKCVIIGTGTWATALGQVLCDNGHQVILFGRDIEQVRQINEEHQNRRYFGDIVFLPLSLLATTNLSSAMKEAQYVILAVPTSALREVLLQIEPHIQQPVTLINTAKGFDSITNERLSSLIRRSVAPSKRTEIVSLIGPSHAEEVIMRNLTLLTSTSVDLTLANEVARVFSNDYFRVYAQSDEIGAEIGVAMKNVIAIASGIIFGLGYGDNARAALITRGLAEIIHFGKHFGGHAKTFQGLTGLGDLTVTCNSFHSRNFMAGVQIGKNDSSEEFFRTNINTVEGIGAAKAIHQLAKKHHIEIPIVDAVYEVLYHGAKPSEMVRALMTRPLKEE
jgi:glycerol-3-phosphate dehydrogenase (NAD(P)+)